MNKIINYFLNKKNMEAKGLVETKRYIMTNNKSAVKYAVKCGIRHKKELMLCSIRNINLMNLKNLSQDFFQELCDQGFTFVSMKVKSRDTVLYTDKLLSRITYQLSSKPGLVLFVIVSYDSKNTLKIFFCLKVICNNRISLDKKVSLFVKYDNLYNVVDIKVLSAENMSKELFLSVKQHDRKLAIFFPSNIFDKYLYILDFIDAIDVLFPMHDFYKQQYELENWAEKYVICSQYGECSDITKQLVYLDFCYNELVINESGIYKKKNSVDYELYMSHKDYKNTFYTRVSALKNMLFIELFGINFEKISKIRMQEVLNLEMDFFWYIEKK